MSAQPILKLTALFAAVYIWALSAALGAYSSGYRGETYTCLFPKAGKVILDTREPGASIMYMGKRHPATSGSYFYQSESDISIAFNTAKTKWTLTLLDQGEPKSETIKRCRKVKNQR
jgi:hypothetical protein